MKASSKGHFELSGSSWKKPAKQSDINLVSFIKSYGLMQLPLLIKPFLVPDNPHRLSWRHREKRLRKLKKIWRLEDVCHIFELILRWSRADFWEWKQIKASFVLEILWIRKVLHYLLKAFRELSSIEACFSLFKHSTSSFIKFRRQQHPPLFIIRIYFCFNCLFLPYCDSLTNGPRGNVPKKVYENVKTWRSHSYLAFFVAASCETHQKQICEILLLNSITLLKVKPSDISVRCKTQFFILQIFEFIRDP